MDALWGFFGVLVGSLLTVGGKLLLSDREAAEVARNERKLAYLELLTSARKLRYKSREPRNYANAELDADRTQLSTANYEIELIANPSVASAADQLRRSTLDYLNLARKSSERDEGAYETEAGDEVIQARRMARMANDVFIDVTRSDLRRKVVSSRQSTFSQSRRAPRAPQSPGLKTGSADAR